MKVTHLSLTITLEEVRSEQKRKLEEACEGLEKCFPDKSDSSVVIKKK